MRPAQIMTILDREFTSTREGHHTPVMLWGPPGVGKSQMVAQVAQRHQVSVTDIRLSQMEPSDLRGIPFRSGDQVAWAVPPPPAILVYFTDADGEFPAREPNFPVIWLVKGKNCVPWGQRVQLN